jgi:hypothetical protein
VKDAGHDAAAGPAPLEVSHLGAHIAGVLAAAENAAKNLIADAEREANEAREEATRIADDIRTRATEEAQAERTSARRTIEEAELSAKGVRSDAESYADARRREADAQAAQIVREAEQRASSLASTADERHRVLLANIAASENRLRELAKSLRAVASSLDSVVGDEMRSTSRAETTPRAEKAASADQEESLEGSLQPIRRTGKADRPQKEEVTRSTA